MERLYRAKNITLIDTLGHIDFIKNTITGVHMADIGILMMDITDTSEARYAVTKQYSQLAFAHGVRRLIIAINKIDNKYFTEQRYNEVKKRIMIFIMKVGYSEDNIAFIPISGYKGLNIYEQEQNMQWYKGPVLFDLIKISCDAIVRSQSSLFRMNVISSERIGGIGTVVIGRIHSGMLRPGQKLTIEPQGRIVLVKSIEIYHEPTSVAKYGDLVGICLDRHIGHKEIRRGNVLVNDYHRTVAEFTAKIFVFDAIGKEIRSGYEPVIDIGSAHVTCRIKTIIAKGTAKNPLQVPYPETVRNGEMMLAKLVPLKPIFVDSYANDNVLGRFTVRDKQIIAVGRIEQVTYGKPLLPYKFSRIFFCDLAVQCSKS
jgi:elongation factor 1-alpha